MSTIESALTQYMKIRGAIGVALIDLTAKSIIGKSGMIDFNNANFIEGMVGIVDDVTEIRSGINISKPFIDIYVTYQYQFHIGTLVTENRLYIYSIFSNKYVVLGTAKRGVLDLYASAALIPTAYTNPDESVSSSIVW